jgi:drug/metabolite transporter (DMT)-like permease
MHLLTNGVLIAIIAHGMVGISLLWDKILLRQPATKNLLNYVFWLGAMSVFGVILIPFGFHMPSWRMALLGFVAGVIHLAANWYYYRALKRGEASQTLAIMGGFSPLATVLIAQALLSNKSLTGNSLIGFAALVAGGFVMFFSEKIRWRRILASVLLASGLFGLTNVLQKVVFNATAFVTGYVFFTIGTFMAAMGMLLYPPWRQQIFEQSEEAPRRSRFWYFVNRFIDGVGSFLIFYAISKANPAVVDAISGVRYIIIFVGAWLLTRLKPDWLREDFRRGALIGKSIGTGLIVVGLVLVGFSSNGQSGASSSNARLIPPADVPALRQRKWAPEAPVASA